MLLHFHEPPLPPSREGDGRHRRKKALPGLSYPEYGAMGVQWLLSLPNKAIEAIQRGSHATSEAVWSLLMGRERK